MGDRLSLVALLFALSGCSVEPDRLGGEPDGGAPGVDAPRALDASPSDLSSPPPPPAPPELEPEVTFGATRLEDCPIGAWCWVVGRPHQLEVSEDRLFAFGPEGTVLEWVQGVWRGHPGLPFEVTPFALVVEGEGGIVVLTEDRRTFVRRAGAWEEIAVPGRPQRLFVGLGAEAWLRVGSGGDDTFYALEGGRWRLVDVPVYPASCLPGNTLTFAEELYTTYVRCEGEERGVLVHAWRNGSWQQVGPELEFNAAVPYLLERGGQLLLRNNYGYRVLRLDGDRWTEMQADFLRAPSAGEDSNGRSQPCQSHVSFEGHELCALDGRILRRPEAAGGTSWPESTLDPNSIGRRALDEWGAFPPPLFFEPEVFAMVRLESGEFYRTTRARQIEALGPSGWSVRPLEGEAYGLTAFRNDAWAATESALFRLGPAPEARAELERYIPQLVPLGDGRLAAVSQLGTLLRLEGDQFRPWYQDPEGYRVAGASAYGPDDVWVFLRENLRVGPSRAARWDGATWTEVQDFTSVSRFTRDSATGDLWAWNDEGVRCLNADCPVLPAPPLAGWAQLFVGGDAIWAHDLPHRAVVYRRSR